jgi:6-phosphofructokinase
MMDAMSIGILTSGGDCPGLNAVIRAAVFKGSKLHGLEFVGFRNGWKGVVEGDTMVLGRAQVMGISKQGGTILGTSRTNPFENGDGRAGHHRADRDRWRGHPRRRQAPQRRRDQDRGRPEDDRQ